MPFAERELYYQEVKRLIKIIKHEHTIYEEALKNYNLEELKESDIHDGYSDSEDIHSSRPKATFFERMPDGRFLPNY